MRRNNDYLKYDKHDDGTMPIIGSAFLHFCLVAAAFFFYHSKTDDSVAGMETMILTAGELADIQAQIRANAAKVAKGNEAGTDAPKAGKQIERRIDNDKRLFEDTTLSQTEAEYQRQMAEFAKQLDSEIKADQQAFEKAIKDADAERAREVAELRDRAESQDERESQNREALENAQAENEARNREKERQAQALGGQSGSLGNGTGGGQSTGDNTTRQTGGTNANRTTQAGGGNNALKAALEAHIRRHWVVPNNASGERLTANISTDSQGNVLSVSISGGSPALRSSLENAIHNASPLTPAIGSGYTSFRANFTAEWLYLQHL